MGRSVTRSKAKQKEADAEGILDSFESWLDKQPSKSVKAKPGYIGEAKIEGSS